MVRRKEGEGLIEKEKVDEWKGEEGRKSEGDRLERRKGEWGVRRVIKILRKRILNLNGIFVLTKKSIFFFA